MNSPLEKPRESKNPKPFVYLGPGSPKLFYPRGPKKITKFPSFVVHKNSLRPHSYLFPSLNDKPVTKPQVGVPDDPPKPGNNNELGTAHLAVPLTGGKSDPIVLEDKVVGELEAFDCGMINWDNDTSLNSPIDFEELMPDLNLDQEETKDGDTKMSLLD